MSILQEIILLPPSPSGEGWGGRRYGEVLNPNPINPKYPKSPSKSLIHDI